MSAKTIVCPCCGRPPTFEYRVEQAKCQLWQQLYELRTQPDMQSIADCMRVTSARIAEMKSALAETTERANAAQDALRRHHRKQSTVAAAFRDNARIE